MVLTADPDNCEHEHSTDEVSNLLASLVASVHVGIVDLSSSLASVWHSDYFLLRIA
jgi:hypothetical protein